MEKIILALGNAPITFYGLITTGWKLIREALMPIIDIC
jgi:hypothetical protein